MSQESDPIIQHDLFNFTDRISFFLLYYCASVAPFFGVCIISQRSFCFCNVYRFSTCGANTKKIQQDVCGLPIDFRGISPMYLQTTRVIASREFTECYKKQISNDLVHAFSTEPRGCAGGARVDRKKAKNFSFTSCIWRLGWNRGRHLPLPTLPPSP